MTRAGVFVIGLRLAVPITILRWPLPAGIVSAVLDAADVILVDVIAKVMRTAPEFGPGYARIDKRLDLYYLAMEALESRGWREVRERRIALALIAYRLIGVTAFEATGNRRLLVAFPNLFENFYLFVLIRRRLAPGRSLNSGSEAGRVLALLLLPKLAQEWLLHVAEVHPWQLTRATLSRWTVRRRRDEPGV